MNLYLTLKLIISTALLWFLTCASGSPETSSSTISSASSEKKPVAVQSRTIKTLDRAPVSEWLHMLDGKNVATVVNHSSYEADGTHIVDALLSSNVNLLKIFAPEHGFKGTADAGESIVDGKYKSIPLISLYGKNKKPSAENLNGIDIVIFDMQDVGVRFYTYISTMQYVMEACAEQSITCLILDRPNPNGHYVDGPIREAGFESFVGMHPIPIVHGMTIAELAQMINGEGWLNNGIKCSLEIVKVQNYNHGDAYELPIKPSPNLPNMRSIYLYPSLCLFEGTEISVGRGTDTQFQVWGHPELKDKPYSFTPTPKDGAKYPKHQDKICYGHTLMNKSAQSIFQNEAFFNLDYLLEAYNSYPDKSKFFLKNLFFDKLAGTDKLRKQIIAGMNAEEIRASWQDDLKAFKEKRQKYLLYP